MSNWSPRKQAIRYRIASFLILAILSFSFFYFVKKPADIRFLKKIKSEGPAFNEVVAGKTPIAREDLLVLFNELDAKHTESCLDAQMHILNSEAKSLIEEIKAKEFELKNECRELDQLLSNEYTVDLIYGTCNPLSLQREAGERDCRMALISYKSIIVDRSIPLHSAGEDLSSMNEKVLIHKLIAKLALGEMRTESEINILEKISLRLKEVFPNNYSSYKAHALSLFLMEMHYDFRNSLEVQEKVSQAFDEASWFDVDDPEISEIDLYLRFSRSDSQAIEQIEEFLERNPLEPLGHYYLAAAYNRDRDIEKAKGSIERAYKISPEDPRITQAYEKLMSGDFHSFNLSTGISIDQL